MQKNNVDFLRLIDANLNRCREGLRVLEDTARFLWSDEERFQSFRTLRHQVDQLTRSYYQDLVTSRQSQQDAGRTMVESKRADAQSVLFANFRRCEESLRVLEEYSKLLDNNWSQEFKALRFAIYELERQTVSSLK